MIDLKTSLGIWALGPMVTRFVPGRLPARARRRVDRREGAPRGRGARRPDRRLRVPLPAGALARTTSTTSARRSTATASTASPPACTSTRASAAAGSSRPTTRVRAEALRRTLEAADFAGELGAHFIIWPGIEGYNYPFQTPYAESLGAGSSTGIGQAAEALRASTGVKLFLEHKNSEPAMKILMRNIGMTLHVIHKLRAQGIDNVQVNMDWQHLIMNGENLAEYAALLAAEGLLGHQHANSGWGTFDDDNMVGATAFMETLELALELRRAGYGAQRRAPRLRPLPVHRGPGRRGASARSCSGASSTRSPARIDDAALREAQQRKDAVARLRARLRRAGRAAAVSMKRSSASTSAPPSVKGVAIDGRTARSRASPSAATRSRPRGRAGRSRTPRTGGGDRAGARRARRGAAAASGCRARCTASSRSTPRPRAAPGDPLERPAHAARVRRDRGARRPRAADRADRQPRADRLHRAEAPVAARPRARGLRADRARPAAEGLRAPAADRRARDRRRRRVRHAAVRRRARALERRGARRLEIAPRVAAARARVAGGSGDAGGVPSPPAPATRPPARSASASTGRGPASVVLGTSGVVFAALPPTRPTPRRACTPSATRSPAPGT